MRVAATRAARLISRQPARPGLLLRLAQRFSLPFLFALVAAFALVAGCGRSILDESSTSIGGGGSSTSSGSTTGGGTGGTPDLPDGGVVLTSLSITPPAATLAIGTKQPFVATGTFSNGTTADVSGQAQWSSSAPATVTVAGGIVTAVAAGPAVITATLSGVSASATVTVSAATIVSIAVTPASATTQVGGSIAFVATATLSDQSTQDVTASVGWAAQDGSVATVSPAGLALGVVPGTTKIFAKLGIVSGSASLTVGSATLVSIQITDANPFVLVGAQIAFTATGTYSDGSIANITTSVTWTSSVPSVVTIGATGKASAIAAGASVIKAQLGNISQTTTVTVSASPIVSIAVAPASATLAIGGTQAFTATATLADMTTVDVTTAAVWSSSAAAVAAVSNAAGSQGLTTALAAGSATILATAGGVTGTASVTVNASPLVSIAVSPADATLPIGASLQLTATGTYADGTSANITSQVAWSTASAAIASVSNAQGSSGLAAGLALGTTTVQATLGGVNGTTSLTVSAATLASIVVTPANSTLAAGASQQMSALGKYSDGTSLDVTTTAVWTTGSAAVATVSNAAGSQGLAAAVAAGTTSVTATLKGISGSTQITVSAPVLVSITVTPIAPTLQVGAKQAFQATGIYSNNTSKQLTMQAQWASSDTTVGQFQGGGPQKSQLTALAAGTTTVTATFGGISGTSLVTVKSAPLVSISVAPATSSVAVGAVVQYSAAAIYADNTSAVITAQCVWTSSTPSVAGITTGGGGGGGGMGGMGGNATALAAGTTTISCTYSGITGSATLTVTAATVTSIEITPFDPTAAVNEQTKFTATAIFSDNTSQNVTNQATWISSATSVAQISTSGMNRGLSTGLGAGVTTISATWKGVTGTTTLTITSATLVTIQVTPFSPTLPIGFATSFVATGIYSDNTTQDLTALATWQSTAPAVAAVSTAAPTKGRVQPLAAGTTSIKATYQGVTGSDSVTVTAATLVSITLSPANATVSVGGNQAFVATGTFSDSSTLNVTTYCTWLSSTPATADVSNAAGSHGVATGISAGATPVTITAIRGMVSGTAQLTVQ
jgi:hypothetical protein